MGRLDGMEVFGSFRICAQNTNSSIVEMASGTVIGRETTGWCSPFDCVGVF